MDVLVAISGDAAAGLRDQAEHIIGEVEALARGHRTRRENGSGESPDGQLDEAA